MKHNPLKIEYTNKKKALEEARAIAERAQHDSAYYDMAARLVTAKKSLSVLETQWKRLHNLKTKLQKNIQTQKREKAVDLEIVETERQIDVMSERIKQIIDILKNLEKPQN